MSTRTTGLDWQAVHARMAEVARRLESAWSPDAGESRRILRERAAALAAPPVAEPPEEHVDVLCFLLAGETWAVESRFVREIFPTSGLTPVPCVPPFVAGIASLRGEIVSVIDLRRLFELPVTEPGELARIVVLDGPAMTFGILAEAVVGISRMTPSGLGGPLPALSAGAERSLKGVARDRTVLLDASALLADERLVVREQID